MARHIYATAPDGTILKRQTDRVYAFAVLASGERVDFRAPGGVRSGWKIESCSASRAGAEKALARFKGFGYAAVLAPVRDTKEEVAQ